MSSSPQPPAARTGAGRALGSADGKHSCVALSMCFISSASVCAERRLWLGSAQSGHTVSVTETGQHAQNPLYHHHFHSQRLQGPWLLGWCISLWWAGWVQMDVGRRCRRGMWLPPPRPDPGDSQPHLPLPDPGKSAPLLVLGHGHHHCTIPAV